MYYRPDFLTGINSQVKRSGGRRGGAERRSSGRGEIRERGLQVPRAVSGEVYQVNRAKFVGF